MPGQAVVGNYAWFWQTVPVARAAGQDRFDLALAALDHGPDGQSVAA